MQQRHSEVLSACLIGNEGSFSHLHFDKDGRHGLLYQVYGLKRVLVFPYSASHKLAPFTQFGFWFIQNFSDDERYRFLEYTGGQEIYLKAGDSVYLPPYCWHYVDYLDDCCSINIRFRRSEKLAYLAKNLFPDLYTQGIAPILSKPEIGDVAFGNLVSKLEKLEGLEPEHKFIERRRIAKEVYGQIFPDAPKGEYCQNLETFFPSPLQHLKDAMMKC